MSVGFYPRQNAAAEDSACACTRLPVLTRLGLVDASSSSEERERFRGEIAVDFERQYTFIIGSPIGEETVDDYCYGHNRANDILWRRHSSLRASEAALIFDLLSIRQMHAKDGEEPYGHFGSPNRALLHCSSPP